MKNTTKVSVIIPAHNEEKYVKRCICSIKKSAEQIDGAVEIIVVCNRCTDNTQKIAIENGARVVTNNDRCIAKVRNAGIADAKGEIIVTIDCDNRMTPGTIQEICELLKSGRYIGGGVPIRFERYSFPLRLNDIMCRVGFGVTGLYCGIFWANKTTFKAVGGFVDKRAMEDVATAKMLRAYGKKHNKKYTCLKRNYLINSTRKYDDSGDWLYFRLMFRSAPAMIKTLFGKRDEYEKLIDKMFYGHL